jgi:predicted nucleic acid-binding protein
MTVLPDTSIWVDYFRGGEEASSEHLDHLLEDREVIACGPVIAEILAGTKPEGRSGVWTSIGSIAWVDLPPEAWRRIGEASYDLAQEGKRVPLTDVVIAVAAIEGGAALWTRDRHFQRIKQVLPDLSLYRSQ